MKVSLFVTCLVDQLYPNVGMASLKLLKRLGCDVDFPSQQTCCGQPAFNSGHVPEARDVARQMLDAFEAADYVVAPSGSCAGMVKHYYPEIFAFDPELERRAKALAGKTYELSQFIVGVLKRQDLGAVYEARATYHPSCHGARLLGVKEEPQILMENVKGLQMLPLARAEDCCGFGGTFSVKMSGLSCAMVDEKVSHIEATGADLLVGTDMGCLMNIASAMSRRDRPVKAMHIAELLEGGL